MTFILDGKRHTTLMEKYFNYPSWCYTCDAQTPHLYGWWRGHWLTCLTCHPEAKEVVDAAK